MIQSYTLVIIKELLSENKGQVKPTEQEIRNLVGTDELFLRNLIEPHLNGIIAHAIAFAKKDDLNNPDTQTVNSQKPYRQVSSDHINALHLLAKKK